MPDDDDEEEEEDNDEDSEDPTQLLSGTWPAFEVQTIRKEKVHLDHYDEDDDGDDDYRDADYHDVKV